LAASDAGTGSYVTSDSTAVSPPITIGASALFDAEESRYVGEAGATTTPPGGANLGSSPPHVTARPTRASHRERDHEATQAYATGLAS
jgi:hypothetical protein